MAVEDRIRDFILDELRWNGSRRELPVDRPLIADHVLDSLGLFQLVTFLETDLGVEVEDDELVPENFGTIAAISRFVAAKSSPG